MELDFWKGTSIISLAKSSPDIIAESPQDVTVAYVIRNAHRMR